MKTDPTLLRTETLAGAPITTAPPPAPPAPPAAPPSPPDSSAAAIASRVPLRETGDEVTPPSPTPVPRTPALELRPAQFDDDDDLARTTEGQALNLAKLPIAMKTSGAGAAPAPSNALPVFFAERRHPEPHPVVHPGDAAPPATPMPTPAPAPSPLPLPAKEAAKPEETPVLRPAPPPETAPKPPEVDDDSLPVWLKKPR